MCLLPFACDDRFIFFLFFFRRIIKKSFKNATSLQMRRDYEIIFATFHIYTLRSKTLKVQVKAKRRTLNNVAKLIVIDKRLKKNLNSHRMAINIPHTWEPCAMLRTSRVELCNLCRVKCFDLPHIPCMSSRRESKQAKGRERELAWSENVSLKLFINFD